ncbi:MAG: sigma-54-dependent Fis family transcriptional regulator [Rhizobiaceae bacterium]|nr:sigma-54-dependent Fis family transcriptional regulator [Rhizobiaceae bacterium]
MMGQVLLIEDDDALRLSLAQALDLEGFKIIQATNYDQARRTIRANFAGVILSDIRMPGRDGFDVLHQAQETDPDLPVILLTGEGDVPMALRAMRNGAYEFLEKPCQIEHLIGVLSRALDQRALVLRNRKIERDLQRNDIAAVNFPGHSKITRDLRKTLRMVAENNSHIHITGPKGAGRRIAAHTIFELSETQDIFISNTINDDNSLALDRLQAETRSACLLFKDFDRLDDADHAAILELIKANPHFRIITTSVYGSDMLNENGIASVLWRALNPVEIVLPSFSQRKEDLPAIFEALLRQAVRNLSIDMPEVSQQVYADIMERNWNNNIIDMRSFANDFAMGKRLSPAEDEMPSLSEKMDAFEKLVLIEALKRHKGQAVAAAGELKLPRKTFYDRLKRYDIRPKDYS